VTEVEIGGTKRGRSAYSFDDIALVPTRRTRNTEDVSTNWKIDAYDFSFPIIAAPMDSVVSPEVAIAYGKLGGLAVLDLEGLWTRYEDPSAEFKKIAGSKVENAVEVLQKIYAAPIKPELIKARIKEIRSSVAELERELAANVIDPEDKDFWNQVKLLKPDNREFWNKIDMSCGNEPVYLDPTKPFDRIKIHAIEAGAFAMIAKSFDDARSKAVPPKFYLDKEEETVMVRTEYKKLRNKAYSELQKLYDKNSTKLFYIAKVVDANSTQYRKSTPLDVLYENMDRYISGDGAENNKERAAKTFTDAVNMDMESLKIKSIVRDSVFFKYIINKPDGYIYHSKTNALLGRNVPDVIEHLKNPLNEDILKDLNLACEKYWNT